MNACNGRIAPVGPNDGNRRKRVYKGRPGMLGVRPEETFRTDAERLRGAESRLGKSLVRLGGAHSSGILALRKPS